MCHFPVDLVGYVARENSTKIDLEEEFGCHFDFSRLPIHCAATNCKEFMVNFFVPLDP